MRGARRTAGRAVVAGIAAALVAVASVVAPVAHAQAPQGSQPGGEGRMERMVTVTASARVAAEPDLAHVSSGVRTEADTAREALSRNSEAMKKLIAGLKSVGIDAKDMTTTQLNVGPRYTNPRDGQPPRINGYVVDNQVTLTVRNLGKLGEILDQMVTLGANEMHGLQFEVSKADELKDEARRQAVANALRRAKLFAEAAGAKVGRVVQISEDTPAAIEPGRPVLMQRAAKASAVPVETGSQELEARVTVTWALE